MGGQVQDCVCSVGAVLPLAPPATRMFTSVKALIFGEDLVSDPVGSALSLALRYVSHGSITVDVAQLSQVSRARAAPSRPTDRTPPSG